MKRIVSVLIFLCYILVSYGQQTADDFYFKAFRAPKKSESNDHERWLQKALLVNPNHFASHKAIFSYYRQNHTSIPLGALYNMVWANPGSDLCMDAIDAIKHFSTRLISISDSGLVVHLAPYFIPQLDSVFEDNVSILEAGFIASGYTEFDAKMRDSINIAERQIIRFKELFSNYDSLRKDDYGFYWDFYFDYLAHLSQSVHLKTACYLLYYWEGDSNIVKWTDAHKGHVSAYYDWRNQEQSKIIADIKTKDYYKQSRILSHGKAE